MKDMCGNKTAILGEVLRPFRACILWLLHFIGLCPMLGYETLSGFYRPSPTEAEQHSHQLFMKFNPFPEETTMWRVWFRSSLSTTGFTHGYSHSAPAGLVAYIRHHNFYIYKP